MTGINRTWTLGDVKITVEEDSLDYPGIRMGLLDPLEYNYTVGHFGGTEAMHRDLRLVIFSGYEGGFLPLVGSGYHSLVSDQGVEGNYFITTIRAERLHANNELRPVFRINAELRKESYAAPVANQMLAMTSTNGLYYCSDFNFDDDTDPEWTLLDGTYGAWFASYNETNPLALQLIRATNGNVYVRQGQSGSWVEILTPTSAKAKVGDATLTYTLRQCTYNTWKDRIFVVVEGSKLGGSHLYVFYTDNKDGTGWNYTQIYSYDFGDLVGDSGTIATSSLGGTYAQGDVMWVSHIVKAGSQDTYWISINGGATWTPSNGYSTDSGGYCGLVTPSKSNQGTCYARGGSTYRLYRFTNYNPASGSTITTVDYTGPAVAAIFQNLYIDPDGDTNMLVAGNGGLKESNNSGVDWSTNFSTHDFWRRLSGISWTEVVMGRTSNGDVNTEYHVVASTPDQGTTRYYKAGADPQGGGSTSIPYNCGGIVRGGLICWR